MNIVKQKKILEKIQELESDISQLSRVRVELAASGYSSATLSSSGGSKSYTRYDLSKITELIAELRRELQQYNNLLLFGNPTPFRTIPTVWS